MTKYSIIIKNLIKEFNHSQIDNNNKLNYSKLRVIDGINYKFLRGKVTGILGGNGSGKSTLLRLISGIYLPNEGEIEVNGTIFPIIGVSAGFQGELSVLDNIEIQSHILGIKNKEIKKKMNEIIEFSELENFLDVPAKHLSTGMQNKLGFSIFSSYNPDILILDEIFSVGDMKFKEKSFNRINKILLNKRVTAIVTSHDEEIIKKFCHEVCVLNSGKIIATGEPKKMIEVYKKINL